MKKKLAAAALSITLCMSMICQTGAAAFSDQTDGVTWSEFDDSSAGITESEPVTGTESSETAEAPETETTETTVPEAVTPSGEQTTPTAEVITPTPETTDVSAEENDISSNDIELFSAGETSADSQNTETNEIQTEILTASDGNIHETDWIRTTYGKWRLKKPVVTVTASVPEEQAAGENTETDTTGTSDSMTTYDGAAEADKDPAAGLEEVQAEDADIMTASEVPAAQEETVSAEALNSASEEADAAENTDPDVLLQTDVSPEQFYTQADGIVHIATYSNDPTVKDPVAEGDYYFDAEGYLITGRYMVPSNEEGSGSNYDKEVEHFFMDEANATLKDPNSTAVCTPMNSDLGQMQKSYWLWTGTTFRYYSSKGGFVSVSGLKTINTKADKYYGYYKINGAYYILKNDGTPCTGIITISDGIKPGEYYCQPAEKEGDIPGKMFRSGWLRIADSKGVYRWWKYNSDGRRSSKVAKVTRLDKNIDSSVGDYTYMLDKNGYILKSKMAKVGSYYYGTDKYGRIYKNKVVKFNGARYYFTSNGRRSTYKNGWYRLAYGSKRYFYYGSTPGKIVEKKGWQRVITPEGKSAGWFYFPSSGNHYVNYLTKSGRYFRTDGRLASGITTVNGKTYFFQSSTSSTPKGVMYKNKMIHYNNKWYYAGSDGVLYKSGWKKIGGYYYYFNSDYTIKTNAAVTRNGVKGYVDSTGKFYSAGWVIINNAKNQVKYIDPETGLFVKNTSKKIDGLTYYFDKNGYRINDLTNLYSGPYYLVCDRVNGVMTVYNSSGTVPLKSIRVSVGLPGTPTWPTNRNMRLTSYNRWQALMGPSWGQYGTHVDGAGNGGIFIHSVAGSSRSYYNLPAGEYNKLGNPASHGCIRCCVADARWVFYNCNGSTIRIIDGKYNANESMKGPLGRRALTPLYGSKNFDPTDNKAWH